MQKNVPMWTVPEIHKRISLRSFLKADGIHDILHLPDTENWAIADAAGKDSAAAVVRAVRDGIAKEILPVIICSGAEHRDWNAFCKNMSHLRNQIENLSGCMHESIMLEDRELWWSFCSRFTHILIERFGFYSPCVGCHTVFHTMRSLLAKTINIKTIISGERELHGSVRKINQLPVALDSYQKICTYVGVTQVIPLRHIASESCIKDILDFTWDEGKITPECALSKNYLSLEGTLLVEDAQVASYYKDFAVPAAIEVINQLQEHPHTSVGSLLKAFLQRGR